MNKCTIIIAALAGGLLVQTEGFTQVPESDRLSTAVSTPLLTHFPIPPPVFLPTVYPGQVALDVSLIDFANNDGYYVTARNGGRQTSDALVTTATTIGPNERFTVEKTISGYFTFQTAGGDYVSVFDGVTYPPLTTQTVLTAPADSTLFTVSSYDYFPGAQYSLKTYYDYYMYFFRDASTGAVGTSPVSTSDPGAPSIVSARHCGDLGSGYQYAIYIADEYDPTSNDGYFLWPLGAFPGSTNNAFYVDEGPDGNNQFTLVRQDDGSYSLLLHNGVNYVTAIDGGGLLQSNDLATNRTLAQGWEKFRITDQGNCSYTIQTSSGYYLAYSLYGSVFLSTDISNPAAAPSVGYSAYFVFRPIWQ
jgi:hypothetical protein